MSGEGKCVEARTHSESKIPAVYEGCGVKVPQVICIRPEAGRTIPG